MLGDITAADEIYIVTGRTDMRKSIDGLCAIVEDQLHMDPRRSALYLFCGKRCDRIKALLWESDGFVLLYKRMEVQGRFRWPRNQLEVKQLTWQQFDWLMSGLEIEQPKAFNTNNSYFCPPNIIFMTTKNAATGLSPVTAFSFILFRFFFITGF